MKQSLINVIRQLCEDVFLPRADLADRFNGSDVVRANIGILADAGFLGLGVPADCGGLGGDEAIQYETTELIASACGVTAFTQQQFRVGIKHVADCTNEPLKRSLLPQLAAGRLLCGIAVSQLRRGGAPLVTAKRVAGGYVFDGAIPWLTGWSLVDGFVLGAALAENENVFAHVDRVGCQQSLAPTAPLPVVVMMAADTVAVEVRDLFVDDRSVLGVRSRSDRTHLEEAEITTHTALPIGCARACERHLRRLAERTERDDLDELATQLMFEITYWRREASMWSCGSVGHPDYKEYALRARAAAIVLAMRAAHAAVAATGGSSHLETSAPQRLLREAQFYTTAVQTRDVQKRVLDQLFSPFFGS